jgi:hypothetical protein
MKEGVRREEIMCWCYIGVGIEGKNRIGNHNRIATTFADAIAMQ